MKLQRGTKSRDIHLQKLQGHLLHTMSLILQAMQLVMTDTVDRKTMLPLLADGFRLLTHNVTSQPCEKVLFSRI